VRQGLEIRRNPDASAQAMVVKFPE